MFEAAQAAQLAGRDPRTSWLIKLDFASGPVRTWLDWGTLEAGGHEWKGVGQIVDLSGLQQVINAEAPELTLRLSGLDATIAPLVRDEFEDEARGRDVTIYLQFLEDDADVALGDPYPVARGLMQRPQFTRGEDGTRVITISCESFYAMRARPAFATYTDADQQALYPGDKGFSFVAGLRNKKTIWPDY